MEQQGQGWGDAPAQLLDKILGKLESTKDFLQFGAVCEAWHCVLKHNQTKRSNAPPLHNQLPMFLVADEKDDHSWSFYNVAGDKLSTSKLVLPYGKRFCGSARGWLAAVNKDWSLSLYKPFSRANNGKSPSVQLPPVFPPSPEDLVNEEYDFHVRRVVLTTDPLENRDKCVIVAVFWDMDNLAYLRLAKDSAWTLISTGVVCEDGFERYIAQDIIHHKDQLYSMNSKGELHSFDLEDPCNSDLKLVVPGDDVRSAMVKRYLVESYDGRLYTVRRHIDFGEEDGDIVSRETTKFQVLKLSSRGKWKPVKDLGDKAMFLGDNSSICVKASNFIGCLRNCIYFAHDFNFTFMISNPIINDLGIYDIPSKTFKFCFNLDSSIVRNMHSRPPIWIVPTFDVY